MSAGHRTQYRHSEAVVRELRRLLADPRVKKLVDGRVKVDFSHEMPLTGGSTVAWGTFFLDPRLKKRFTVGNKAGMDLSGPVLRHEVVEKALRMVFGMGYDRAHILATCAERLVVESAGMKWGPYKDAMESIVRRDEHERPAALPKGYDTGPLRASRGLKSLRGLTKQAA